MQQRVRGTIGAAEFASNVKPAGRGRLALSVSRQILTAAGLSVGDIGQFAVTSVGRD